MDVKTGQIELKCEGGLHLRVAAQVVKEAKARQSTVHVSCKGCPRANACSIFELLKLGAVHGTPMEITVDGPDEDEALAAIAGVFDGGAGI
jgi:phosphocarrier protein HPr